MVTNYFVSDLANSRVRKITSAGVVITFVDSTPGCVDSASTTTKINSPFAISLIDTYLHLSDLGNQCIRKLSK